MKYDKGKFYIFVDDISDDVLKEEIYYEWLRKKAVIIFKEIILNLNLIFAHGGLYQYNQSI